MPHPTIQNPATYQPDLLRRGVQITGLLREMAHLLRKAGRTGHNTSMTLVPFADGPRFFQNPTQDLCGHVCMRLAFLGRHAQAVVDGVATRLMAHPANANGWFQPRFSLDPGNLKPVLYVPSSHRRGAGIVCDTPIHLCRAGDLGRALALSDLALASAPSGPNHRYIEKWGGWNTTGVVAYAPNPATALLLVWAWRQPKETVAALAGGTTEPLKSQVERPYGADDWLWDRTRPS